MDYFEFMGKRHDEYKEKVEDLKLFILKDNDVSRLVTIEEYFDEGCNPLSLQKLPYIGYYHTLFGKNDVIKLKFNSVYEYFRTIENGKAYEYDDHKSCEQYEFVWSLQNNSNLEYSLRKNRSLLKFLDTEYCFNIIKEKLQKAKLNEKLKTGQTSYHSMMTGLNHFKLVKETKKRFVDYDYCSEVEIPLDISLEQNFETYIYPRFDRDNSIGCFREYYVYELEMDGKIYKGEREPGITVYLGDLGTLPPFQYNKISTIGSNRIDFQKLTPNDERGTHCRLWCSGEIVLMRKINNKEKVMVWDKFIAQRQKQKRLTK